MTEVARAHRVVRGGGAGASDHVALDYEGRFLRRRRLVTAAGAEILADLAEAVSLEDGDALEIETGALVGIVAAPEPLLEVRGASLARLAWHIGNRHTPCRIEENRLLIRADHVLAGMLRGLGADVVEVTAPFTPEGGAYGHGRVMGHDHGHGPGHGHDHGHDHGQGRAHG
jgi:urease accessory protein